MARLTKKRYNYLLKKYSSPRPHMVLKQGDDPEISKIFEEIVKLNEGHP